jgi:mono/diheme cytochrome c family protein
MKIISLILFLSISTGIFAQEWTVPADRKGKLSPFKFNDSTRNAGQSIYNLNCMSCHGTPGKGNVQKLTPPPADPATDKIQHNADGELFYKISEGRSPMPSFKNTLSSKDIWNVISFIRSLNPKYVQQVMTQITSGEYAGALLSINVMFNNTNDSVFLKVLALRDNITTPVTNAGLRLFIKRNFGQMPVGEEVSTDQNGVAAFLLPRIPGDTAGNLYVSARLTNEDQFGEVAKDTILKAGVKAIPVSLTKKRAMWNVVTKAPIWLLITYFAALFAVWGIIFYILIRLRDIYVIGKHVEQSKNEGQ